MNHSETSIRRLIPMASALQLSFLLIGALTPASAVSQEVAPWLVYPVAQPRALTPTQANLVRAGGHNSQVTVNWDLLNSLDGSAPTKVTIPLGSDAEIPIVLERRRQVSRAQYVWTGRVDRESYTEFNLSVNGDEARFHLVDPGAQMTLAMRPTEQGIHMLFNPTASGCATCEAGPKKEATSPLESSLTAASFSLTTACPTDCSTIFSSLPNQGRVDVLFYYTPEAKDAAGTKTKLINDIHSALAIANSAHSDSGTGVTLRYLGALPLPAEMGTEATLGDIDTINNESIANNLNTSSTMYYDRGYRGADLICVVTTLKTSDGVDGQARIPFTSHINSGIASEEKHVSAIKWDNLERILHHELGHNFGAGHDAARGDGTFDCSHGFVEDHIFDTIAGNCVAHCQTVMAYGTKPFGDKDFNDRIGRFSDPNAQVTLSDNCLGLNSHTFTIGSAASQYNVRTICNTKRLLASYRQGVYFADNNLNNSEEDGTLEEPYLGLGTAIDAAENGDIIRIKAGSYVPRTISKARTLTSYGGNVTIGR